MRYTFFFGLICTVSMCMVNSSLVLKTLPQVWHVNFLSVLNGGEGEVGGSGGGIGGGALVWPSAGSSGFLGYG